MVLPVSPPGPIPFEPGGGLHTRATRGLHTRAAPPPPGGGCIQGPPPPPWGGSPKIPLQPRKRKAFFKGGGLQTPAWCPSSDNPPPPRLLNVTPGFVICPCSCWNMHRLRTLESWETPSATGAATLTSYDGFRDVPAVQTLPLWGRRDAAPVATAPPSPGDPRPSKSPPAAAKCHPKQPLWSRPGGGHKG